MPESLEAIEARVETGEAREVSIWMLGDRICNIIWQAFSYFISKMIVLEIAVILKAMKSSRIWEFSSFIIISAPVLGRQYPGYKYSAI